MEGCRGHVPPGNDPCKLGMARPCTTTSKTRLVRPRLHGEPQQTPTGEKFDPVTSEHQERAKRWFLLLAVLTVYVICRAIILSPRAPSAAAHPGQIGALCPAKCESVNPRCAPSP